MYTFPSVLDRARTLFGDQTIEDVDETQTYAQTYENASRLAGHLREIGVGDGDVVAVADWNTRSFFELLFAVTGMGAVLYPVNVNLPPDQIGYTLQKADASVLFYSPDFEGLTAAFEGESIPVSDLEYGEPIPLAAEPDDDAVILFTSGTTGMPKAVPYVHEEIVQGALAIAHQLAEYDTPASLSGDDVLCPSIPMYHIVSWGSIVMAPYLGARLVLGGRYDPAQTAKYVEERGVTWTNMVPTMVSMLLQTDADLDGLKILTGGSAIPAGLAAQMAERGVEFSTIYGGTDMLAAAIAIRTPYAREQGDDYLRTTTHPVPFGRFEVVEDEASEEDMGELYFQAPWLPQGYLGDEEATVEAFTDDGWFKTGDIGREQPDGGIQVLDRVKDAIKSGGEWIPSSVLESVITELPWVAQTAVLARPDEQWGERPVAVVTPGEGTDSDADEILDHLNAAAAAGKIKDWWIPDADDVRFQGEMPMTSTGKIRKASLREDLDLA